MIPERKEPQINTTLCFGEEQSTLVEKAVEDLGEENIKKAEENLKKGSFSMQDYLV